VNSVSYDLARAYDLYQALFTPFADVIKNKRLLIVASGPLTSLPLEALLTENPAEALPPAWDGYRGVKWLGREHSMAVLPSVASLSVLRKETEATGASEPYIGFGDPKLEGNPECGWWEARLDEGARAVSAPPRRSLATRGFGAYLRGAHGDIAILKAQCPLPEASTELMSVAKSLRASPSSVRTQAEATETAVKHAHLDKYRVLHFATHGLLAGQAAELVGSTSAEAALVLTPPDVATDEDDGLRTRAAAGNSETGRR
jgi:CHAT domain-containing protein